MRISALILLALAILPGAAQAAEIAAASRVEAVTVFPDRAQVTRSTRIDIPAGAHAVIFEGLPGQLLTESLKVEGTGSAAVTVGSVDSRRVTEEQPVGDKERELANNLLALRDKRDLVEADIKALQVKQSFIEAIGKMAPDGAGKDLKKSEMQPERWQQAWTTLEAGATETFRALVQKRVEQRTLDDQIRKVEEELRSLQTGRRDALTVRVNVEAAAPATLALALSYQVPEAGWRPIYEARLDTGAAELVIDQQGSVHQRTGEDWQDVELSLSTARPSLGTRAPQLPTWWLDFPEPRPPAQPAPEARLLMKQDARGDAKRPDEASLAQAQTVATEFAAEYRIPGLASVPGDRSERRVGIGSHAMPVTLSLHVVPKATTAAFLSVEGDYSGAAPLLPGALLLFRDGAFIGNGRLDMLRPDEKVRLSFGVDDKVRVQRTLLAGETSQQGIVNKDRRTERRFRTVVENLHRQAVRISVFDNLPVSRNENIRVELLTNATTAGFTRNVDDRAGVLAWEATWQPGEKKSIDFGYAVTVPSDRSVPGF